MIIGTNEPIMELVKHGVVNFQMTPSEHKNIKCFYNGGENMNQCFL